MSVAAVTGLDCLPFAQAAADRLRASSLGCLLHGEIVVDLFAGGGGATCGIEAAGLVVHECVNHSATAIETHAANHPETNHRCGDVWGNAPEAVANGRPVGLLWASPDCRHFSRARGAAPVSGRVRSLAWVAVKWAKELPARQKPRIIIIENVAEFIEWGPTRAKVDERGRAMTDPQGRTLLEPVPERKGETFRKWVRALKREGYEVDWRVLDAAQPYVGNSLPGAACRRKRLFVIARRDGMPVCWPEVVDVESSQNEDAGSWSDLETASGAGDQPAGKCAAARVSDRHSAASAHDAANRRRCGDRIGPDARGSVDSGSGRIENAGDAVQRRGRSSAGRDGAPRSGRGESRQLSGAHGRCAADIIDWTDLGSSIFDRKKPLAEKTLARIAEGIRRYVLNDPAPFVLRVTQTGGAAVGGSVRSVRESVPTQTTRQDLAVATPIVTRMANGNGSGGTARRGRGATPMTEGLPTIHAGGNAFGMATPLLATVGYGERSGQRPRVAQVHELLGTCVNGVKQGLVSPVLMHNTTGHTGGRVDGTLPTVTTGGQTGMVSPLLAPMTMSAGGPECKAEPADRTLGTVLTRDHRAMVAPVLTTLRQNTGPTRVDEVGGMNTVTASGTHAGLVAALMVKFYGNESGAHRADASLGTVTTKDRHALVCVMIDGTEYVIVDILFRMLKPSELADAMGFPASYVWPKTQREAVKLIGNAVSPPMAEALVRGVLPGAMQGPKAVVA